MARLTHKERLKRLQDEYAKIVKPSVIIGEFVGETMNINTTIIYNTLLRENKKLTADEFSALIEQYSDCDIILGDTICQISEKTRSDMFSRLSVDELRTLITLLKTGNDKEIITELVFSTLNETLFSS